MRTHRDTSRVPGFVSLLSLALVCGSFAAPVHGQDRTGEPYPVLAGARVIVLPFRNISGDTDTGWVGNGIAEALAIDLQAVADAEVIGRPDIAATLTGLGLPDAGDLSWTDALAIGRRAGAHWLIHGGYQRVGPQILMTARIVDSETGAVVRTPLVDGPLEDLFALQDRILPGLGVTGAASAVMARTSGGATAVSSSTDPGREPVQAGSAPSRAPPGRGAAFVRIESRCGSHRRPISGSRSRSCTASNRCSTDWSTSSGASRRGWRRGPSRTAGGAG